MGIRYSCSGDLYDDDCTEKDLHNHNPGLSFILFHYLLIINFSSLTPLVLTLAFSNLTCRRKNIQLRQVHEYSHITPGGVGKHTY